MREVASKLVDEYLLYMQLMRRLELVVTPIINEIVSTRSSHRCFFQLNLYCQCADIVTDCLLEQNASQIVQSLVDELVVEICDSSILKV